MAYHPHRYLGNKRSKEVHDTYNETSNCQLNEIVEKEYFSTLYEAHNNGYDNCHWCIGNSKR